jgi:hypothetical protein
LSMDTLHMQRLHLPQLQQNTLEGAVALCIHVFFDILDNALDVVLVATLGLGMLLRGIRGRDGLERLGAVRLRRNR